MSQSPWSGWKTSIGSSTSDNNSSSDEIKESESKSSNNSNSSWMPNFFSTPPNSSTQPNSTTNIRAPSISSSPSTNEISSQPNSTAIGGDSNLNPADSSSFLRGIFSSLLPWPRSNSSSLPADGVTESGLRWHRLNGESGFAIESPSGPPASDEEIEAVRKLCSEMTEAKSSTTTITSHLSVMGDEEKKSSDREVGVIDLESVEWWTLLDPNKEDFEESIEEDYVVINHEDATEAVSAFLASVLASHPHAASISPKELRDLVDKSLQPVKPSMQSHRYVSYGYYAYLAYSWSSTAYSLYRRPWLIKLAATGAMKIGSWFIVLLL